MSQFDWPITKKKLKLWRLPKMEDSIERRGGLWEKHMELKRGAIGNTLGEHIENLMGTHWELEGNMLGTKEKNPLAPHPKLKRDKKIIINK